MQRQSIMHSDHFVMPAARGIVMLAISWTLSLWSKYSLRLDLNQLLMHITPSELVGVLSGLGSFGLSIITAWHYLSKIRDMKRKDKENKEDKPAADENKKGQN